MDKEEYIKKAEELLNQETYKVIPADSTTKQKNNFISLLKNIKAEGEINEETYKRMYPTGADIRKFYDLPKIHKAGVQLKPIVSIRGAVSYNTAKELARILKPLVGKSPWNGPNTRDFVQQMKNILLQQHDCIISYDAKALFTSVPIEPATEIIRKHLEEDKEYPWQSTTSSVCWSSVWRMPTSFWGQVLWTGWRSCYGFSHNPYNSKFVHGGIWKESPQHSTTSP